MTTEKPKHQSWLTALAEAARQRGIALPTFAKEGMGIARSETMPNGRYATLKRRLVRADDTSPDAMEWTLWESNSGFPHPAVSFRQPLVPEPEAIELALSILNSWLLNGETADEIHRSHLSEFPLLDDVSAPLP